MKNDFNGPFYMQPHMRPQTEMGMMVLTPLKLFLMRFLLCWLNRQLKINWLGIHCGQNHTNFMVMGMNCFLYAVTTRESLSLRHARYSVIVTALLLHFLVLEVYFQNRTSLYECYTRVLFSVSNYCSYILCPCRPNQQRQQKYGYGKWVHGKQLVICSLTA